MQKVHPNNQNKLAYFIFYVIGVACGVLGVALIIHVVFAYQSGEASAYASTRSYSILNIASRASAPSQFWFHIGAWCLGAVLLLYLAYRFIQIAKVIGEELRNRSRQNGK